MKLSESEVVSLRGIGLSDKAARIYVAAIELGESTIQELARKSKVARTSIYHVIEELIEKGCLVEAQKDRRALYIPTNPEDIYISAREKLREFEAVVPFFKERMHSVHTRSKILFFHGSTGFKRVWDMVFESRGKQYQIITPGRQFLEFVKEKYIIEDIIKKKTNLGYRSRQLIIDTTYSRNIASKDRQENRQTRFLPGGTEISFTEIICDEFVAFISTRTENMIFVVEHDMFAETRKEMFEVLWKKCA